jgi:putative MATE family efflux protein
MNTLKSPLPPREESFLGTQPIAPLLARLSVPAMIGMIVNALYNLIDTIFVGQGVGPLAIAGLGIAFPIQMLIGGFAQMYGVGAASIVSRRLGEQDEQAAADAAGTSLTITVVTALIITTLGLMFIDPLLMIFGSTQDILPYAGDYLSIILFGSVFLSLSMSSNNIIRAEGQSKIAMMIMIIGTGSNILLDPIFIFALDMGIRGAATATVISQVASATFAILFFARKRSRLPFTRKSFRLRPRIISEITVLGLPTFVRQTGTSIMTMSVNNMLRIFGGDIAIAAYGMISKLRIFFLMPIFGIVQGFQPIAGYNYGAKKTDRVKQVLFLGIGVATAMGTVFMAIIEIFPRLLLSMFTSEAALLDLATPALRIAMMAVPFIGIQTVGATLFQSIGKSVPALFLGLSRQFIFLIPLILILPRIFGLGGVWIAFPIADTLATIVTSIWLFYEIRHLRRIHFEMMNPVEKFPNLSE